MRPARAAPALLALPVWLLGLSLFVDGEQIAGGVLILAAGLWLVVVASKGFGHFIQGLADWLAFWR